MAIKSLEANIVARGKFGRPFELADIVYIRQELELVGRILGGEQTSVQDPDEFVRNVASRLVWLSEKLQGPRR